MFSVDIESTIGQVAVQTTQNKGLSPEYWTERILERLVSVSDNADPMVKAQAHAFRDRTKMVITYYVKEGIKNHICTVCNELEKQGHKDLANIIRRL